MDNTTLGATGLPVSRLCLGTANFGWQLGAGRAGEILDLAADSGITFLDTSDAYPGAEDILGELLGAGRRADFILATKGGGPAGSHPWDVGTSRKHLLDAIDASLRRLRTDYVDIYFPHIYDPRTPQEETLSALDTIVRSGRARYVGCSNYQAYQVARAVGITEGRNLTPISCVQTRYNLLSREFERELAPFCAEEGLGVMVYNPLAGGLLTGKHDRNAEPVDGTRFGPSAGGFGAVYRSRYWHEAQFDTVDQLRAIAAANGLTLASLAAAWVMRQPRITSTIVGASRPDQLAESIAALTLALPDDVVEQINAVTSSWRDAA